VSERAIGIDLGTSNSCVAVGGETLEVLPNAYGEHTSASVVHFAEDGTITVGNAAKANIIHEPDSTVSSAKRLIGRYFFSEEVKKAQAICAYEIVEGPNHGVRIQVRDETFSLPEVSAMVLREMKQIAEARLGGTITKAVITVPAYFNDNQRQATKDAGRIAGLEVLRILNEPTAAALAYGFGRGLDQRVAVYDLGGGTFDVSILEIGKDIFEVLATCGDTFLGGDDFDDRIIDLLADEITAQHGVNVRNDPYAFEKLKVAAENAKKALSEDERAEIRIPDITQKEDGTPVSLERTLDTSEFGALIQDLIQRTFKVCDEAMQQADLTVRDLDGVIMVGGPTRLPIIRQVVEEYFQQAPKADVDPDEVVAMGAAIHAASLVSPDQDSMLLDVTPLDLRIGVAGGLTEPVIERNTPVPIEQMRRFTPAADFQESVQIRVYQGDQRQAEENELLGEFGFSGFQKGRRSDVAIDVTFEINADGIVNVSAADPNTGERAATTIALSSGLSDEELADILNDDPTARVLTADGDELALPDDGLPELPLPDEGSPAGEDTGLPEAPLDESDFDEPAPALETAAPEPELDDGPGIASEPLEDLAPPLPPEAPPGDPATVGDELDLLDGDDLDLSDEDLELEVDGEDLQEVPPALRSDAKADVVMELDHAPDPQNAITAPDLDGAPDDEIQLEEVVSPPAPAEDIDDLFDHDHTDLSADPSQEPEDAER